MKGIAIIVAAGKGERAGVDKVWSEIAGKRVVERAAEPFFSAKTVDAVVVVVREERLKEATELFAGREIPCSVIVGGSTRSQSVRIALAKATELAAGEDVVVAIHDGARPYLSRGLAERCMLLAAQTGSAVPVLPCTDSLRTRTAEGSRVLPREEVLRVQTPQCFLLSKINEAYAEGADASDDATLYEKYVSPVTLTEGEEQNEKITYLSDIFKNNMARAGVGYDVHPLVNGRPLILGGVTVPHDKGLDGHSDADALTHAIMDAILTAAGQPDIGHRFPPDDPKYEGADSIELLKEVATVLDYDGYVVQNVSATVMAQKPKLAPYLPQMEKRVAQAIGIAPDLVTFAATTTERLGIVGEEKGIAAEAIVLLRKASD